MRTPHTPEPLRTERVYVRGLSPKALWLLLVALLFGAAIKQDAGVDQAEWQGSSLIGQIRMTATFGLVLVPTCWTVLVLNSRRWKIEFYSSALMIILLLIYEIVRVIASMTQMSTDSENASALAIKLSVAFLLAVINYTIFVASSYSIGYERTRTVLFNAVFFFCLMLVVISGFLLLQGAGVNPYVNRFSGATEHPNFLGVQLAICCTVFLFALFSLNSLKIRLFALGGLTLGVIELVNTGSRSGLLFLVTSSLTLLALVRPVTNRRILFFAISSVVAIFLFLSMGSSLSDFFSSGSYDRGGANTRSEAWAELWQRVVDSPITGSGVLFGASENSYLRGWATYGIAFPLIIICITAKVFFQSIAVRDPNLKKDRALIISVLVGLGFGAIFEGYLLETFSLPLETLLLSLLFLDQATARSVLKTKKRAGSGREISASKRLSTNKR